MVLHISTRMPPERSGKSNSIERNGPKSSGGRGGMAGSLGGLFRRKTYPMLRACPPRWETGIGRIWQRKRTRFFSAICGKAPLFRGRLWPLSWDSPPTPSRWGCRTRIIPHCRGTRRAGRRVVPRSWWRGGWCGRPTHRMVGGRFGFRQRARALWAISRRMIRGMRTRWRRGFLPARSPTRRM